MSGVLQIETLSALGRAALERLIITLGDSKRLLGIRYSDWTLGAPSIETGIAASSMAQDEWGHARLLYAMLKDLDIDPVAVEHNRPGDEYASLPALDEAAPDWAALVVIIALADAAIASVLRSFSGGTFEPAQTRVSKMLAEEEFHSSLGAAWYKRLAEAGGEARELLTEATNAMLPSTLAWVGADDAAAQTMVEEGVIGPAAERLASFRDDVRALVALVGIDLDSIDLATDWDEARGRTAGRPNEEAVERARGDRNRELLVE